MKSNIKLIIFDLDGTLLDTALDVHACANETLKQMNLAPVTIEKVKTAIGPNANEFAGLLVGPDHKERFEEFFGIFRPFYLQNCTTKTAPFPDILQLLQAVRGCRLAVATNKPVAMSIHILNMCHLLKYFDFVVGPEMVQRVKPHPDMLDYVLHLSDVAPKQALMVGDTENDLIAAKVAHMKSCFAEWGYSPDKQKMINSADFHITNPMALLNWMN